MSNDSGIEPITTLDLSAYSEGLLTPERAREVQAFLEQHPEAATIVNAAAPSPSSHPFVVPEAGRAAVRDSDSTDSAQSMPAGRSWLVRHAKTIAATAALLLCGIWGTHRVLATNSTLDSVEQSLISEDEAPTEQKSLQMRQALMELDSILFLLPSDRLRRSELMAKLYLLEAKREIQDMKLAELRDSPSTQNAVQLATLAIDQLQVLPASEEYSALTLARAFHLRAMANYLTASTSKMMTLKRSKLMNLAAADSLSGLETLQQSALSDQSMRLQLGWLLAKSLHKGGVPSNTNSSILNRILALFPSTKEVDNLEVAAQICRELKSAQPSTPAGRVALLNVYNTLGLILTNISAGDFLQEGRETLETGIGLLDDRRLGQTEGYPLVKGRLLGNLADLLRMENTSLEEEIAVRQKALRVFVKAVSEDKASELFFERGWVTARQLLAKYKLASQTNQGREVYLKLLGALAHDTNRFQTFRGLQLGPQEEVILSAIYAEEEGDRSLYPGAETILKLVSDPKNDPDLLKQFQARLRHFQHNAILANDEDFQAALNYQPEGTENPNKSK